MTWFLAKFQSMSANVLFHTEGADRATLSDVTKSYNTSGESRESLFSLLCSSPPAVITVCMQCIIKWFVWIILMLGCRVGVVPVR
jgi:hypothetical protein